MLLHLHVSWHWLELRAAFGQFILVHALEAFEASPLGITRMGPPLRIGVDLGVRSGCVRETALGVTYRPRAWIRFAVTA